VWSAIEGYPGDYFYREFYRDIGWDLEFDYIRPYISPDGHRKNTGIKYYRITGETNQKEPYNPTAALEKAASHAGNFMFNREKQVEFLYNFMKKKPIIVSPYDAELFGHWWFEGPQWINFLARKIFHDQKIIKMTTPSEYLAENPVNQVSTPSMSSWGYKGYCEVWLDGSNDWIYPHLHQAADRMIELAQTRHNAYGLEQRALNQAARELLLAQSSDWAFIMKTGTMVNYAIKRTRDHVARFTKLYEDVKNNHIDEAWLSSIESKDNLFPEIDYRIYA
jgi:1,4-alpha-glucan branching enzyme